MHCTRRRSPILPRTWIAFLGAALGLVPGGIGCESQKGAAPAASRPGSGSEPAVTPATPAVPATPAAAVAPAEPAAPVAPAAPAAPTEPAAPAPSGEPRALSDEETRTLVTPRLRAGEKVAHKPFRGSLGTRPDVVLVVVERDGNAGGFVLVPGAQPAGKLERIELPPLSQGLLESVPAVLFVDVDDRPGKEAIIMTLQMTGAGPQGAIPRAFNQVIAWDGSAFVRLSEVEEALLDLDTAARIRKALAARARKPKQAK